MICLNCKNEITDGAKFCKYCGKEIVAIEGSKNGSVDLYFQNKNENIIDDTKKEANAEIFKGLGFIILGIVLTAISYSMADAGGTYHILWGLSVYGLIIFVRGVYYRIFPN